MSNNERLVSEGLRARGIPFEVQPRLPLEQWHWKKPTSKGAPKADFRLTGPGVHVEVKGWLTLLALAKMSWIAMQPHVSYYVLVIDNPGWKLIEPLAPHGATQLQQQLDELLVLHERPELAADIGRITRARLKAFAADRVGVYTKWVGEFP